MRLSSASPLTAGIIARSLARHEMVYLVYLVYLVDLVM
jgi:hypothetical protein